MVRSVDLLAVPASNGDVAQLVEHLLCKQGVGGSSPLVSTEKPEKKRCGELSIPSFPFV
jgi:hypothetical protein